MRCTRPIFRFPDGSFAFTEHVAAIRASSAGITLDAVLRIPCGRCVACLKNRARSWTARFLMEYKTRGSVGSFITLTYSDENLPRMELSFRSDRQDPADGELCSVPILEKSDLQKFFKRARRAGLQFSYLACGEYGSKGNRPHFHACLAGAAFDDVKRGQSATLQKLWPYGFSSVGSVEPASVAYVAGYVLKRAAVPTWRNDPRPPEFQLMSRRPALGRQYLLDRLDSISRTGKVSTAAGTIPAPRYFSRLLEQVDVDQAFKYRLEREAVSLSALPPESDLDPDLLNEILDADSIRKVRLH